MEPTAAGDHIAAGLLVLALAAPVQCPAHREPRRVRTEPPAEAVYRSAEHLRQEGHVEAYRETLLYVIERYPQTQWAARARDDLAHEHE